MSGVQQNTFEKRSAEAKNNAAIGAMAMLLAKESKDPMAVKASRFKKGFLQMKAQIVKKYMAQARSRYFASRAQK